MEQNDIRPHIAAVARPGDVVLIGFEHLMSDDELGALKEQFRELVDLGVRVGVFEGVTSMVVFRGDNAHRVEETHPKALRETLEGYEVPGER